MPLPVRREPRPVVVISCKTWKPMDVDAKVDEIVRSMEAKGQTADDKAREGVRGDVVRGARMLRLACAASWLQGGMPETFAERLRTASHPLRGVQHMEFAVTYACTWRNEELDPATGRPVPGTGAGSCDAPGCNSVVRPYHAVTYTCDTTSGVHGKEWPRQQDEDVWSRYDVWNVTPEEAYRLKLYAHAMLGAAYRPYSPLTYLCGSRTPEGADGGESWRYYVRVPPDFSLAAWETGGGGGGSVVASGAACVLAVATSCWTGGGAPPPPPLPPPQEALGAPLTTSGEKASLPSAAAAAATPASKQDSMSTRSRRIAEGMRAHLTRSTAAVTAATSVASLEEYDRITAHAGAEGAAPLPECVRAQWVRFDEYLTRVLTRELEALVAHDVAPIESPEDVQELHEWARAALDGAGVPLGAAAHGTRADLTAHIRSKMLLMHRVAIDIRARAPGVKPVCSLEGRYKPLCELLNTNGMAVPKLFTCCEFVAAAFLFAGLIRTRIDPHTSLLNNVVRCVADSGRCGPYATVDFFQVFPRDSDAKRADLPR